MKIFNEKCFVIACDATFVVTKIITIKNLEINLRIHDHVSKIILPDHVPKFLDFSLQLRREQTTFGVEISIITHQQVVTMMNFAGIKYGEQYIITAFSNYLDLYEELMTINNEYVNILREQLKKTYVSSGDYQKFTELNNEIINMQRELYKKNAYVSDLLEKKQEMIHTIETQKNFLKQMINAIPDIIFYKDTSGTYLGCNKAFAEQIIGVREEDIIGKRDGDFVRDAKNANFFEQQEKEVLEVGQSRTWEASIALANGTSLAVETVNTPFYDEQGTMIGMIGIARDISVRKNHELAVMAAKEQAVSATIMKSQFLATMSHEIRTPMNGILGFLDLLQRTDLSLEQKEYLKEAKRASEMLLYLISDILDISKIEAGKLTLEAMNFKLRTTIEDAVGILVPKAFEKNIELHIMIKSSVPDNVIGDSARLGQILNNLLSNAIKFTAKGEINIRVDCAAGSDGQGLFSFEVQDTGIGISEQNIKKLFNPFVQADTTTTRLFGGTGLGLAISKEIVKLMQGDISVTSEVGKGSTFRFTLVLGIQPPKSIPEFPEKFTSLTILIVDDNGNNRNILRTYLEEAGCNVVEATGAKQAIAAILMNNNTENMISIVIVDLQMPGMNGYQLATTLQTIPGIEPVKLILLASAAEEGVAEGVRKYGFSGYVAKPVRRDELLGCIGSVIGRQSELVAHQELSVEFSGEEEGKRLQPKILLVEDNDINRKIVVAMLKERNMTCEIAIDGQEAVAAVMAKDYDIVFMDCQLPVMDGYESTATIRELEGDNKHTIIVAMTANVLEGEREKTIQAGMDDYLSKPIDFTAMFRLIAQHTKYSQERVKNVDWIQASMMTFMNDSGLNKNDAQSLFTTYMEKLPNIFTDINDAITSKDFEQVAKLAHRLKGSSGNLRINFMWELAMKLEEAGKNKAASACEKILLEMKMSNHVQM